MISLASIFQLIDVGSLEARRGYNGKVCQRCWLLAICGNCHFITLVETFAMVPANHNIHYFEYGGNEHGGVVCDCIGVGREATSAPVLPKFTQKLLDIIRGVSE